MAHAGIAGNSATLLPDGSVISIGGSATVLPTGGLTGCGGSGCTVTLNRIGLPASGPDLPNTNAEDASGADISRSSHTATLLPNGQVLVAGGISAGNVVRRSLVVYDTRTGAWTDTGLSMTSGRYNHTANLLLTGSVLLCGGATVANPGAVSGHVTNSCDLYTPFGVGSCGAANGCVTSLAGANGMLAPRMLHTASLLGDGRVFFTGGWDGFGGDFNTGVPGPIVTSEIFNPATNTFGAAHALIEGRYNHSATVMGDGRILIAGGFNGKNVANNFGILNSAEIYDPKADSIAPAAPMLQRNQAFSMTLNPDGGLEINGGLGNVTTTFLAVTPCQGFNGGSQVFGTDAGVSGGAYRTTINNGSLTCQQNIHLTPDEPTGQIESGFILYSSPTISLPFGKVFFGFDKMDLNTWLPKAGALFSDIQGTVVSTDSATGQPGTMNRVFPFSGYSGQIVYNPFAASPNDQTATAATINFAPSPISNYNGPPNNIGNAQAVITGGSTLSFSLVVPNMPAAYYNSNVFQGTLNLLGATIEVDDVTTGNQMVQITLTQPDPATPAGVITWVGGTIDGAGNLSAGAITATALNGTVQATSATVAGINSPIHTTAPSCGAAGCTIKVKSLSGIIDFNTDRVTVDGLTLNLENGLDTLTIKSMMFTDQETYSPVGNSWSFTRQNDFKYSATTPPNAPLAGFGGKAVLLPNATRNILGGIACDPGAAGQFYNNTCPSRVATNGINFVPQLGGWENLSSMLSPRANLTATPLPGGKILLIGGTSGTNVLNTAELYNDDDPSSPPPPDLPTGNMTMTRDQHTATLLTDGRVLVAGGFTTTGSTGATNTAELYYPGGPTGNGYFIPAGKMANSRDDHAAVLGPDGNPIIIGGYDSNTGQYLKGVEVFFSTGNTWGQLKSLTTERALFTATLLRDGRVLVAGGVNSKGPLSSTEIYDPTTNSWAAGNPMPVAVYSHRATMLPDGRVIVSGGDDGFGETTTSVVFNPATGLWTATGGSLVSARLNHDALVLPNGIVIAVGGAQALGQALASVETFDVYSSSWQLQSTAQALVTPRAFQATVLADNGELLTFGGSNNGTVLSSIDNLDADDLADQLTPGGGENGVRQSTIAAVDLTAFDHVSTITISGSGFRGRTEASAGGAQNADFSEPRIVLTALDSGNGSSGQGSSGFYLDVSTRVYSTLNPGSGIIYNTTNNGANNTGNWSIVDSSISIAMPSDATPVLGGSLPTAGNFLPYGWYALREGANGLYSKSRSVRSGPFLPSASVGSLAPIANPAASFYAADNLPQTPPQWITSTTVHWAWTNMNNCAGGPCTNGGFDVYIATTGVFVSTIAYSTNVFVQSGLAPNTTVSIIVAPYNLSGDGPLVYSATFFTLSTAPVTGAFSISSVAFAGVQLSWQTNGNQQGTIYEVSESTDDPVANGHQPFTTNFSTPVPTLLGLTSSFTTITGLLPNTVYNFRVRSMNGAGLFSNFSAIVSTATRSSVAAPSGQAQTTYSIQWTWPDAFIPLTAHYNIYNATSGFLIGQVAEPPVGNTPTFVETGLSTNTANAIAITAVTTAGEGPLSASATVFTLAAVPGFGPPITNVSSGSLSAFWTANQNPINTVYDLVLSNVKPLDPGLQVSLTTQVISNNAFSVTFNALTRAGSFPPAQPVAINAYAVNGDGILSPPLLLTPLNGGTTSLLAATPAQPVITGVTGTSISLSWGTANNASTATYEVTYSTDGFVSNISTAIPYSALSNATSLTLSNLLTGTTYQFRVRSFDIFGTWNGVYSPLSVTTGTANGGAPVGSLNAVVDPNQNVTINGTLAGQRPFTLFIPANTFAQTVTISISTAQFNPPAACSGGGPYGLNFTVNPPLEPLHPAYLTLTYTPPDVAGMNLTQLALERIDSATGKCVPLATTVNQAASQVTATINHFSLFQLAQVSPSSTIDSTLIFPNPFMPTEGNGYVTFSQLPGQAHIQIFTLKGALVTDGIANDSGIFLWPGTNKGGRPVASGVYIVVVRSGDHKRLFKVVVLR